MSSLAHKKKRCLLYWIIIFRNRRWITEQVLYQGHETFPSCFFKIFFYPCQWAGTKWSHQSVTYWRMSSCACKSVEKINSFFALTHENYKGVVFTHLYVFIQVVTESLSPFVSINIVFFPHPSEDRQQTDQDVSRIQQQKRMLICIFLKVCF